MCVCTCVCMNIYMWVPGKTVDDSDSMKPEGQVVVTHHDGAGN